MPQSGISAQKLSYICDAFILVPAGLNLFSLQCQKGGVFNELILPIYSSRPVTKTKHTQT